ncbi:hypothetical protein, partial [Nocardioides sp.]|uniref:hypothetical protein n=1 Tax=Nocardioides sp. TaxID=35761 RepID=UPI002ED84C2C
MRNDADFAAYLAARWPFVVRTLVLVGCPQGDAEDLARLALARCYEAWDEVLEADDVDVVVYREVLDRWHRAQRRRRPDAAQAPEPPESPESPGVIASVDSPPAVLLRRALVAELAGLAATDRETLVLRFGADLAEVQVSDVL